MADLDDLFNDLYTKRTSAWENACTNAVTFVKQAVAAADPDGQLLYSVTSRVKQRERALAKVQRKFPDREFESVDDLEVAIGDWVGVKVTCNTTADAEALIVKLKSLCEGENGIRFARKGDGEPDVDDYIRSPKSSGYRAYHAVVLVTAIHEARQCEIRTEIQIKTRLQDAWGELTHENFYKYGAKAPSPFHTTLAKTMADLLAVVDSYADALATQVALEAGEDDRQESAAEASAGIGESLEDLQQVVKIFHLDPRYALARDDSGHVGLIRAVWIRDLLVEAGEIEAGTYISVDEVLNEGQELLVTRREDNDNLFFEPVSLTDPCDMEPDFDVYEGGSGW